MTIHDDLEREERKLDLINFELWWEHEQFVKRTLNPMLEANGMKTLRPLPRPEPRLRRPRRKDNAGPGGLTSPPESALVLVRTFPARVATTGKGRTLEAVLAPYNTPATVADPPHYTPYRESFRRGCFYIDADSAGQPQNIVNFEHQKGVTNVVGHALSLIDRPDALHATLALHDTQGGSTALELVQPGVLRKVSIEFRPLESKLVGDVLERVRVRLGDIALCRRPAYASAKVTSIREGALAR